MHPEDELRRNREQIRQGFRDCDRVVCNCDPLDELRDRPDLTHPARPNVEAELGDTIDPAPVDSLLGEIEDWL